MMVDHTYNNITVDHIQCYYKYAVPNMKDLPRLKVLLARFVIFFSKYSSANRFKIYIYKISNVHFYKLKVHLCVQLSFEESSQVTDESS